MYLLCVCVCVCACLFACVYACMYVCDRAPTYDIVFALPSHTAIITRVMTRFLVLIRTAASGQTELLEAAVLCPRIPFTFYFCNEDTVYVAGRFLYVTVCVTCSLRFQHTSVYINLSSTIYDR